MDSDGGTASCGAAERRRREAVTTRSTARQRDGADAGDRSSGGRARRASTPAYLNQGGVLELPEAGDFEGDQAFSVAAWVKLPANDSGGAILGADGRPARLPRLGLLDRGAPRRRAHHQQVARQCAEGR